MNNDVVYNETNKEVEQVHVFGKTFLPHNRRQFYIRSNDLYCGPDDHITSMAAGDRHAIIVTGSGHVFGFGDNSSGRKIGS
jgi:alpha-tubulin suppressor-like RCC1 family protein